ncbi:HAD-IB family hydrolase [Campylobacter volucris]|uniref:HAD-IB family hydrolase n=1 Tax=Campylobacter volucris TaxID=1031542 RepID=A0AAE6CZ86_9BACT|nr:HAD-IB family hydrolase [Campylobacter volucris]AJC93641.1 HAD-superfamily hydrolase, subfamily IB [Campylobacter volucris LMG 24379]KAB0579877.1 HAD-IB family hydrolase [Campylobacter volucris]QBL13974.1 HAD-IB family hydrolase [Campylobacter volucris]QEL07854.1 HAD superfamily hydrolase, subfamily IB [Campylobacter volucris]TXK70801.1 HAD-IB family hydrolase [Campylobacter volucris]
MSKKILALFDFCETITNFQTLDRYLPMAANRNINYSYEKNIIRRENYKSQNIPYPRYEWLIDLDYFLATKIGKEFIYMDVMCNLNKNIMDKLFWHQDAGHDIAIVSGGLSIYINEFAKIYNIDNVIAVDLEVLNGKLTGNIDGIHTMQERKLYKLSHMLDLNNYDLKKSYAYSDCVSDIPLLSLVGNPNVVKCGKNLEWAKILGFNIINP